MTRLRIADCELRIGFASASGRGQASPSNAALRIRNPQSTIRNADNPQSAIRNPQLPVRHLYLHVPFCRRRCSYCDFAIAVRKRVPADGFVDAVARELALRDGGGPLDTLYFGGGTPSLLPPPALAELIERISARRPPARGAEVTLEANPEDVTAEAAARWRAAGVTRVSLGVQSFDERVLAWMHRSHGAGAARVALDRLRAAGITDVSLDLIFALPAELQRDWSRDLDLALALEPSHLSLYGLTVEERTPLARWVSRGAAQPTGEDRYAAEYLLAHRRLAAAGYAFYEVSNAARPGHRSRHNSAYWTGAPYLGLGPAAHSFDGTTRRWNFEPWEAYRRAVTAGRSPVAHEETLTPEQRELERIYLGLRTAEGLDLRRAGGAAPSVPSVWLAEGWVELSGHRLRCTAEGWLRLDALAGALTGPSRSR
jgi:oxygen-independent coproporphyrinogen-3 oxidase